MKHINALTIILVIVALIFVCIMLIAPAAIGLKSSEEKYVSAYFNPDTVNTVSITISDENWADILENPMNEEYHEASITINGDAYQSVGIRTKGMTSLSQVASSDSDRYSLKIKSDEYVAGQTFLGLNKFVLNNNYGDPSYMKEYLSYQMLTEMGVPTPLYAYAAVYINGEYWGLYLMVEAVEEDFASRNFGMNYGQLYKPDSMNMGGGGGGHDIDRKMEDNRDMQRVMEDFGNLTEEEKQELFKNIKGGNFQGITNQRTQMNGDGTTVPTMPDGTTVPTMPDGTTRFGDMDDFGNFGGGGGPGGSGGGADLVYSDDNVDSYSTIFDNAVFTNVSNNDKERVITALKNLGEGTNLEKYIDVDTVLRYFAANTALVNMDSYTGSMKHNYYLYEEDGKLLMIPWDWNLSFGSFQGGDSTSIVNFPIDTPISEGMELSERPMIGSLLAVDSYKEKYHEYLRWIATDFFGDTYEERINKIDAMIAPYVEKDPTSFYTFDEYKSGVEYVKLFGKLRAKSILGQLNGTIPSTWEGQAADSTNLVDGSELDKYDSGGFGGGGEFNKGNKTTDDMKGGRGNMPTPPS